MNDLALHGERILFQLPFPGLIRIYAIQRILAGLLKLRMEEKPGNRYILIGKMEKAGSPADLRLQPDTGLFLIRLKLIICLWQILISV